MLSSLVESKGLHGLGVYTPASQRAPFGDPSLSVDTPRLYALPSVLTGPYIHLIIIQVVEP